jgi:hypothetical protein
LRHFFIDADALGIEPYFDQPFYVGFNVGGYELGLHPEPAGDNAMDRTRNAYMLEHHRIDVAGYPTSASQSSGYAVVPFGATLADVTLWNSVGQILSRTAVALTLRPLLAARLPVALGSPGGGYPWPWSVRRWIDGRPAAARGIKVGVLSAGPVRRGLLHFERRRRVHVRLVRAHGPIRTAEPPVIDFRQGTVNPRDAPFNRPTVVVRASGGEVHRFRGRPWVRGCRREL